MRRRWAPRSLIAICLGAGLSACGTPAGEVRGPFRGQLIDAESGQPIAGAVILAIWETVAPSPVGHGGQEIHDAREAISDRGGRFEIPRLSAPAGRLDLQPPRLCPFAPGYAPAAVCITALAERVEYAGSWPRATIVTPPYGQRFVDPTIVRMRPIKTRKEWCEYAALLPPLRRSMADRMPLMLSAIDQEKGARGPC
jgi:hypothetical protein